MSDVPTDAVNETAGPELTLAPPAASGPRKPSVLEVRLWCGLVFLIAGGMLGLGAYLTPSPDGFGKHRGLFGMPACGFYQTTGYPCPTCGCTTAVSHFAHGHIVTSFLTQPFGFAVALVGLVAAALGALGMVTGKWYGPSTFILSWYWRLWVFGGIGIMAVGWVYKCIIVRMGS